jgi:hypothetical protein
MDMKVLVLGAWADYDGAPTVSEYVCVDGQYHATRVSVVFEAGPDSMEGSVVREYQDLRHCDGSCGISTMTDNEQTLFEDLLEHETAQVPA